jgi:predicted metal-dependent HD superfamily phosphohydrolase
MNLKSQFEELCSPFTEDGQLIANLWKEIETQYSENGRHYHNLLHLANMFRELEVVRMNISDFTALSFSVFYHDVIYDATSKANEEKSAAKAVKRLAELHIHQDTISIISAQILATKFHQRSDQQDTNYILDADLSVLGKDFETYLEYTQNIRKEYSIYPDFLYKPGRKKVLKHFLELESIFKTEYFKGKYEAQAKENIAAELRLL